MTLDQIQVIDIIVKKGSFSGAAQQLNRAQSAVSYTVKNIEEEWGIKIFDRSSYRAKLTPAGEAVLGKIRAVLKNVDSLDLLAKQLSEIREPIIRLSVNNLFPLTKFMPILLQFKNQFPNIQLQLAVDHLDSSFKKLEAGKVDLAITMEVPQSGSIDVKSYYNVQLVGVAASNYFGSKNIDQADLVTKTQIIVSSQKVEEKSKDAGLMDGSNQWVVADLETKKEMIHSGLGFGYMPLYMVVEDLKSGKLTDISCMKKVKVPMKLQKRVEDPIGPAKQFFWESTL